MLNVRESSPADHEAIEALYPQAFPDEDLLPIVRALVRDPEGVVHRVRSGNYLGRNNGKVLHVAEDRLRLSEVVWSDEQGWEDRAAEMALRDG